MGTWDGRNRHSGRGDLGRGDLGLGTRGCGYAETRAHGHAKNTAAGLEDVRRRNSKTR